MIKFVKFLLTLNAFLLLSACGGDNSGLPKSSCGGDNNPCAPYPVELVVTPDNIVVPTEVNINYIATVTLSDGSTQDVTAQSAWQIGDNNIATITTSGVATTVSSGTTSVSASYSTSNGITVFDDTILTVNDADLIGLDVTPLQHQTLVGLTTEYRAYARYQSGERFDVTQSSNWQIQDAEIAEIQANDSDSISIVAKQPGITDVRVAFKSLENQGQLAIIDSPVSSLVITPIDKQLPLGTQAQYQANLILENGQTIDVTLQSIWQIEDDTIGQFNKTQVLNAASVGSTSISAAFNYEDINLSDSTSVTVTDAVAQRLLITPQDGVFPLGTQGQYKAEALYSDGHVEDVTLSSSWRLADNIGSISPNGNDAGYAIATSVGQSTVSAQFANLTADTSVEVTNAELVELSLTPINYVTPSGTHVSYTGYARFTDESVQDVTKLGVWSSSEQSIANIGFTGAQSGIAKTYSPGVTQICLTYLDKQACTSLTVTAAESEKLVITPVDSRVPLGIEGQYIATAYYTDGHTADVTKLATWQTSDTNIAAIETSGLNGGYTISKSLGQTNVSASFEDLTDSTSLTITDAELVSLVISPSKSTIAKGNSQSYEVIGQYSDGSYKDLTSQATWQSSDNTIAYISSPSMAFGAKTGTAQITATVQSKQVTAKLTVTTAEITRIAVTPTSLSIAKGHSGQLSVTAYYTDSTSADVTQTASWQSADSSIAAVPATGASGGLVSGLEPGQTTVTATYSGMKGDALITVTEAVLEQVVLEPKVATVAAGVNQAYSLRAIYSDGTSNDVTALASWASSAFPVATIDAKGLAITYTAGQTNIIGQYQGKSDTGILTVTKAVITDLRITPHNATKPKGTQGQYTATAFYSDLSSKDVTKQALWRTNNSNIVSIQTGSINPGLAFGENVGTTEVSANYDGLTAKTDVTVTDAKLVSVEITPKGIKVPSGLTTQFELYANYSDTTQRNVTSFANWQSSELTVASINNSGLATTYLNGITKIKATFNGMSDNANLTVTDATITHIQVTPTNVTVPLGTQGQFEAQAFYSDGHSEKVTTQAVWLSDDTSIINIESSGIKAGFAWGQGVGTTNVTATFMGFQHDATVTVTDAELVSIKISPVIDTTYVGGKVQYQAFGIFTDSSNKDLTTLATWFSDDSSIASLNAEGLANANDIGDVVITASYNGITSNNAYLEVGPAIIQSLVVHPTPQNTPSGTDVQFLAHAYYSDSSNYDVTDLVNWTNNDTSIASHLGNGLYHGLTKGTTEVIANYQGETSTGILNVTEAILEELTIDPLSSDINVGATQQYKTYAAYSDGSAVEVTTSSNWQIVDTGVASVNVSGLVTGNAQGTTQVQAEYNGKIVLADVNVTGKEISRISVSPFLAQINAGQSKQFTADAIHPDGTSTNVTQRATWTSDDASVASVVTSGKDGGLATSYKEGATFIQATYNGLSGKGQLTVLEPPPILTGVLVQPADTSVYVNGREKFRAYAVYNNDISTKEDVTDKSTWTVTNTDLAYFSTPGIVNGTEVGSTTVTAVYNAHTGIGQLTVLDEPIEYIEITPNHPEVPVNTVGRFTAEAYFVSGSFEDITEKGTWRSSDTNVASIVNIGTDGGKATALSEGTSTISIEYKGVTDISNLTVTGPTLLSVYIDPASFDINQGNSQQANAWAVFSDGSEQNVSLDGNWTTDSDSIAQVTNNGGVILVEAFSPGNTQLNFTYQSETAAAPVAVVGSELERIEVTPKNQVAPESQTIQLYAKGFYKNGDQRDITNEVNWRVSDDTYATIDESSGSLVTITRGETQVIAEKNGIVGEANLTVSEFSLYLMEFEREPIQMRVGQSQQLRCYAIYVLIDDTSIEQRIDVTNQAEFKFRYSQQIAELTPSGYLTAKASGSSDVTCEIDNGNGSYTSHDAKLTITY